MTESKFNLLTDEDALSVLAFRLRANPGWSREDVINHWVLAALAAEFEPCETCAGIHSMWRKRCQAIADVFGASFNEWDDKWIS